MSCREASKLNLTQCLKIREDHYRSENGKVDYEAESIDSLIYKLQNSLSEKANAEFVQSYSRMERATRNN